MHLGACRVFDLDTTEDDVIAAMDAAGVAASIVQPYPGAPDASAVHDRIAALAKRHPSRVFGAVSLNPHVEREIYQREAKRCVRDLGFVGLKLHTFGHAVNPLSTDGATVFETARELGVPVIVHTGPGTPFADPAMVLPRAHEFSDLKIVLAHAGYGILSDQAVIVAKQCANVLLETSWCGAADIGYMIGELGESRVLFGSDLPQNVPSEIAKYRSLGLAERRLNAVLARTAIETFMLRME
jgi:hypothetical protein